MNLEGDVLFDLATLIGPAMQLAVVLAGVLQTHLRRKERCSGQWGAEAMSLSSHVLIALPVRPSTSAIRLTVTATVQE